MATNKKHSESTPLLPVVSKFSEEDTKVEEEAREKDWDDAVSIGMRRLCRAWMFVITCWYASVVVKLAEVYSDPLPRIGFLWGVSAVFFPLWMGSFGGMLMIGWATKRLCGCHKRLRVVSKAYQLHLIQNDINTDSIIAFDSLPLLRLYYASSLLSIVMILCCTVSQVMWFSWIVLGAFNPWEASLPVGLLILSFIIYLCLWKTVSWKTGVCWLFVCFIVILLVINESFHKSWNDSLQLSWFGFAVPVIAVLLLVFTKLGQIVLGYCRGKIQFKSELQWVVWWFFFSSATLLSCIVVLHLGDAFNKIHHVDCALLFIVATFVEIGLMVALHLECYFVTSSKGFTQPIPLKKNAIGTYEPWPFYQQSVVSLVGTVIQEVKCPQCLVYSNFELVSRTTSPIVTEAIDGSINCV